MCDCLRFDDYLQLCDYPRLCDCLRLCDSLRLYAIVRLIARDAIISHNRNRDYKIRQSPIPSPRCRLFIKSSLASHKLLTTFPRRSFSAQIMSEHMTIFLFLKYLQSLPGERVFLTENVDKPVPAFLFCAPAAMCVRRHSLL